MTRRMSDDDNGPPDIIAIDHDDHSARYVGRTADGGQFFLTTPFEPATDARPGCEYLALYRFDDAGQLVDARIEDLGPRATMDEDKRVRLRDRWLDELGEVSYERIEVAPFVVNRFGTEFGLVAREPDDDDGDVWAVEMQPGNYMAFFEPW